MTRRLILPCLFVAAVVVHGSTADGQFELTEPAADSDDSQSSPYQQKSVSPRIPVPTNRVEPRAGGQRQIEPTRVGGQHDSLFELLNEDGVLPDFFSGPIPRTKAIGEDASLNDVCHIGNRCWAVGERGVICISDNGGQSWTTAFTPMECSLRSVCFLTNNIGWVAGLRDIANTSQETAVLIHTRDGGKSWRNLAIESSSGGGSATLPTGSLPGILHVQYFGLEEAIAITLPVSSRAGNGIFRSEDGGQTWSVIGADQASGRWNGAHFLSSSEGIVVGNHQSYAAVVSNQAVMINPPQPTLREMRGVTLSQNGEGWIVGDGATMLATENAGVTWRSPSEDIPSHLAEVIDLHAVAHHGSTVLAGGNPGSAVLRSESGGSSWMVHEIPMSGRINRIRFLTERNVVVIGSLGQILLSVDAGVTWQSVRSPKLRSGVLNLVTDADRAAWKLLANVSGDNGVRSVVLQTSQPMDDSGWPSSVSTTTISERTQLAVTQLGGNETASDWMFPRTRPEHHLSSDQLIAEWNRQTDGRLRRLLPLRLARDIRNWRPAIIVIEPTSDDDAIAAILRDVMPHAIQLAAEDERDSQVLSQIGLRPWMVARVVSRVAADRSATLFMDDADLLTSLGTTIGLLSDVAERSVSGSQEVGQVEGPRTGYEIVFDQRETTAVKNLLEGLEESLTSDARRPVPRRSQERVESLSDTLQAAHLEGAALSGQAKVRDSEDSLIGELQRVGINLPDTLALKQLKDLANLNLQQNNMESWLAIQQEVTRRFPTSEDARTAAEMLFLFYSSAESRHYRIRSMFKSPTPASGSNSGLPVSSLERDRNSPNPPFSVPPEIQAGQVQALSAAPGNQLAMLQERWDSHAATALRILDSERGPDAGGRGVNPLVLLRQAANLRKQNVNGEQHNQLAEVSQRDDQLGLFARSEMQVLNAESTPVLPLFNIPRRSGRPFLDGKLTDEIWEAAEEIALVPFVRNTASPDSPDFTQPVRPGDTAISSLVMVAWDEQFFYLAARLERPDQKLRSVELATHRSHDEAHGDRDRVELEIDTDRDFGTSFQLAVDESGLTSDRCWMLSKWNPEWFVAVDSDETTWRLEAAIPLAELSAPVASPGNIWSIKLRRIFPGVFQHELVSAGSHVSTNGTGLIRFIRPRVVTKSSAGK